MKLLAAGVMGWTLAALAILLLVGGQVRDVPCAGTVGAGARSAACHAEIAAANAAIFSDHTLPLLFWIALGYLVVGGLVLGRLGTFVLRRVWR